jgi:hypothetical protein
MEMTFGDIKKDRSNGSSKPKLPPTLLLPTKDVSAHKNGTWTLLFRFCKPKAGLTKQNHPPCNKFYPFTKGQLREYDSELYQVMSDLWKEIEQWEDPDEHYSCGKGPGAWFPFLRASHNKKGHFRIC